MRCPQCDAETPDDGWNCVSCRINLYWAVQHYEGLAGMREQQGLPAKPSSPSFLIRAHRDAMNQRAARGEVVDNKVRSVARKVMQRRTVPPSSAA